MNFSLYRRKLDNRYDVGGWELFYAYQIAFMAVHIIIDGYNFIRQSMSSCFLNTRDLQQERDVLVGILAAYKRRRKHTVTVVFDGTRAPSDLTRSDRVRGVEVVFSRTGETADTVIKQLAAREGEKALVVSSDREVSDFAAARGATVMRSEDFEYKLFPALEETEAVFPEAEEDYPVPPVSTVKKGPRFRLSRKQRKAKKKTRKL